MLAVKSTPDRAPPASEAGRAAGTSGELAPDREAPELEGGQPEAQAESRD